MHGVVITVLIDKAWPSKGGLKQPFQPANKIQ